MTDTIFALASGAPPAAIAILRVSGPGTFAAVRALAGPLPAPRSAALRGLRAPGSGALLDRALVLVFTGPASATGEDVVELHLHGGRAVVAAVEAELARQPGLRRARPGEFTRRALANGRIDLAQAEGLGDLLMAETEAQRRSALTMAEGAVSRMTRRWRDQTVHLAAAVEAVLNFGDESDVDEDNALTDVRAGASALAKKMRMSLAMPSVDRVRDGVRVVLAGPPNSGKSTLLNALVDRDAAIVSPVAGTTRDLIEVPVQREGRAYLLIDTAGLREVVDDPVERIGVDRAAKAIAAADVLLWLGDDDAPSATALPVHARVDAPGRASVPTGRTAVSATTGSGIELLWREVARRADGILPASDAIGLNGRQRDAVAQAAAALLRASEEDDPIILAEHLRSTMAALARVTGGVDVEAMLDTLFSRFCIGK